jgi:hypothetical protein
MIDPYVGEPVNGRRTLGDNIADNAGIRIAYRSFMKHLAKHGTTKVRGFKQFTPEQSFFIAYGTVSYLGVVNLTCFRSGASPVRYPPTNIACVAITHLHTSASMSH